MTIFSPADLMYYMIQSTSNDNALDSSQPTLLLRFVEELVIRDTDRLDRHVINGRTQRTSTQLTAMYFKAHKLEAIKTQTVLTVHLTSSGNNHYYRVPTSTDSRLIYQEKMTKHLPLVLVKTQALIYLQN